jgi:hypothetical protein
MNLVVQKTISFDEFAKGDNSTVRVTADGLIYAVDLVMAMTGKNCNDSNDCLREMKDSLFAKRNFLLRGRSKVLTMQHALELVMVLPSKVAKETRNNFANIIKRYIAGDESLMKEIRAKTQSTAQLARADEHSKKRKYAIEEMELEERRLRLTEMAANTQKLIAEAHKCEADAQRMLIEDYTSLCPNKIMDDSGRLMFKDYCLNLVSHGTQHAITNGELENAPAAL